jgi:hypothetical protein
VLQEEGEYAACASLIFPGIKFDERSARFSGTDSMSTPRKLSLGHIQSMSRNKSIDLGGPPTWEPGPLDVVAASCCISEPDTNCDNLEKASPCSRSMSTSAADLPFDVLPKIARCVLQSASRQQSVIALLAMCGVCRQWRRAVCCLEKGTHLLFDGTESQMPSGSASTYEQKFRSLPQAERARILFAAAQLLKGEIPAASRC